MELIEYPDSEMMMLSVAQRIASQLREALTHDARVSLAVPGGTTPGPVFDSLASIDLDWDRVSVMLTDERWVPESSERSNTALLRRRLLVDQARSAELVPLVAEADTPEEALDALTEGLVPHLPLTVALLGMGTDMHTASIFPGADRLQEALTAAAPLIPMRAAGAPEPRITLSAQVLNAAMHRHVLIIGAEKREALEAARNLPPEEAPIHAILTEAVVHWAAS